MDLIFTVISQQWTEITSESLLLDSSVSTTLQTLIFLIWNSFETWATICFLVFWFTRLPDSTAFLK